MRLRTIAKVALRVAEVRARALLGRPLRPYKALLELTSACNSRCTTCAIWKNPPSVRQADLKPAEITTFLKDFGKDLVWLALSGGEVTLVEHFPEVVEAARRFCPNLALVTFTTNGLLPEKAVEYARRVLEQGFDLFVTVSLDGDAETHDRIRGVAGNHALAVRTLRQLREAGVRAHFGITLGDANRDFVATRFPEHQADIKAVTFVESGGIYRQRNQVQDEGVLASLAVILRGYRIASPGELIEWLYLRLGRRFLTNGRRENPVPCDVLRTSIHVRPGGEVLPCMFLPAIGNLRTQSFREILHGKASRSALGRVDRAECPHCWMNCYAPHSILSHPVRSIARALGAS